MNLTTSVVSRPVASGCQSVSSGCAEVPRSAVRNKEKNAKRFLVGLGIVTLLLVIMWTPASAHITVHPSSVIAGTSDVELTFRCPNERDDANTVMLQVFLPTNLPLLTVEVLPLPGWTATVQTENLSKPINTDDGSVSQIVSEVTWKATAGGIGKGQYEDFDVGVGAVPDKATQLAFKALQTYSSGEIVRWIEVPVAGQQVPDTPAPILTLTEPSTLAVATGTHATAVKASSSNGLAIAALALGAADLVALAALGGLLIRRERILRSDKGSSSRPSG